MASIYRQPSATCSSLTKDQIMSCGIPKVPSAFHSIESLMMSYGPTYPIEQENGLSKTSDDPYSGLQTDENTQSYLPSLWAQSSSHPFYNNSDSETYSMRTSGQENLSSDRSDCLLGIHFTQQPAVSDLSVNPFQDQSEFNYDKKHLYPPSQCSEVSPATVPTRSVKDEILDVDSYSPFGSPVDSDIANQTKPGPCSTSSAGYSSGYQSCEGSTENSPFRALSVEHPLQNFHECQADNYNHGVYHHRQMSVPQSSAPGRSPVVPNTGSLPSALSSIPSKGTSNPLSVPLVDLPHQVTPTMEPSLPPAIVKPDPEAPITTSPVDETQVKKTRVKYTSAQLEILEKAFNDTPYPDWDEMEELSKKLDIAEQKIKVWFQNKRARWRKKNAAQQLQEVAVKYPQQTSALYRFPSSLPRFQLPNQASQPEAIFPGHTPAPRTPQLPFQGQRYYTPPSHRAPSIPMSGMSDRSQTLHAGFNLNQPSTPDHGQFMPPGPSPAYYQPHTVHHRTSGVSHIAQSNYDNYGHRSNNFMYPYM